MDILKKASSSSYVRVISQIVIWLLLLQLVYDLLGLWESLEILFFEDKRFVDEAFIIIPSLILLFYWNSNYLIPKLLTIKSWWYYVPALIGSSLIFLFAGYFVFNLFWNNDYDSFIDPIGFFEQSLILHLIVVGVSTSLGISRIAMDNARQKKDALEKQKEAELNYLKAQVSPHFLFNTLNTIYSISNDEDAPKTAETILLLSENMRYMVREASNEKVDLRKEIEFIKGYIELQLLRLGGNVAIHLSISENIDNQQIAPLLLIPFIENIFKHGVSYQSDSPIFIEIKLEQNILHLHTKNTTKKRASTPTGAGIENTKKRLAFLYPQQHELTIKRDEMCYQIFLNISL